MSNQAAWIKEPKGKLQVDVAPEYEPKAGEVLIKNGALAINPVDWKIQARMPASRQKQVLMRALGLRLVKFCLLNPLRRN
jgi:NADPH:quinone reductase-like Zn-dependent oxidoreductase